MSERLRATFVFTSERKSHAGCRCIDTHSYHYCYWFRRDTSLNWGPTSGRHGPINWSFIRWLRRRWVQCDTCWCSLQSVMSAGVSRWGAAPYWLSPILSHFRESVSRKSSGPNAVLSITISILSQVMWMISMVSMKVTAEMPLSDAIILRTAVSMCFSFQNQRSCFFSDRPEFVKICLIGESWWLLHSKDVNASHTKS